MASLVEFLKTGHLGVIAAGMSRDQVRAVLGEPEDVSVHRFPQIWKYGSLQLLFYRVPDGSEAFLAAVTLYFHNPEEHPPETLALTGWVPTSESTYDEIRGHLDREGIPVHGGVAAGANKHLVLGSAVRITFDEDRLYSIGYTEKREPEMKQLTIRVHRKDLEVIANLARGRRVSATDLCSEWIREQVSSIENIKSY